MKKFFSMFLIVAMLISMGTFASAANSVPDAETAADDFTTVEFKSDTVPAEVLPYDGAFYEEIEPNITFEELDLSSPSIPVNSEKTDNSVSLLAGTYSMIPSNTYTHGLASASDYNFYISQVSTTETLDANVFFLTNNVNARYVLGVAVYDATLTNILSQVYFVTDLSEALNYYNFYRVTAQAGQHVVLLVQANNYIAGSTYSFGISTTARSSRDLYENNNHRLQAYDRGAMTTTESTVWYCGLDNMYDVDWYKFTFDGSSANFPTFLLSGGPSDIKGVVLKEVNGNITNEYGLRRMSEVYQHVPSEGAATYYVGIVSDSGGTGDYTLKFQLLPRWFIERRVNLSMTSTGDQGTMSLSYLGSLPTARYRITATIKATDSLGNPAAGVDVSLEFIESITKWVHAEGISTTNAYGTATIVFNLPGELTPFNEALCYRSSSGYWTSYYQMCDLKADVLLSHIIDTQTVEQDWYYYFGQKYNG